MKGKKTNKAFFLFGSPCKPCIQIWQFFLISFIFEFWQLKKNLSHFILAILILNFNSWHNFSSGKLGIASQPMTRAWYLVTKRWAQNQRETPNYYIYIYRFDHILHINNKCTHIFPWSFYFSTALIIQKIDKKGRFIFSSAYCKFN